MSESERVRGVCQRVSERTFLGENFLLLRRLLLFSFFFFLNRASSVQLLDHLLIRFPLQLTASCRLSRSCEYVVCVSARPSQACRSIARRSERGWGGKERREREMRV